MNATQFISDGDGDVPALNDDRLVKCTRCLEGNFVTSSRFVYLTLASGGGDATPEVFRGQQKKKKRWHVAPPNFRYLVGQTLRNFW